MVTLQKHLWICYLLPLSLLFGSCHVYQKIPVTLDDAVSAKQRVKIITANNQKLYFQNIEKVDSTYYGVEVSRNVLVKKPFKKEEIWQIQLQDKPKSRLLSISVVTVAVGLLVLVIGSNVTTGAGPVGGF